MDSKTVILVGVGIYLVAMVIIGILAAKKAKSATDFVVAGRSLSLPVATATLMATWMGAGTIMGAAGAAYEGGVYATIADPFGAALCLFLAGLFFVRILRRMRLMTIIDFYNIKYGTHAAFIVSLALMVVFIGWIGAQLVAFGFILHTLTGISTTTGILIATVVVLAYTAAGGMWAVALTDMVQVVVMMVGLVILLPLVISDLGGWDQMMMRIDAERLALLPPENTVTEWGHYLRAWMIIGVGSLTGQDLMQRVLSSRSEKVAQNATYLAGVGYLTFGMIPVFLGLAGALAFPDIADPEFIIPELAMKVLSPVLMAIFVGALLAAIMSSADSAILAPASVIATFILPTLKPGMTDDDKLKAARWSVPVIGLISLAVALWAGSVYDLMLDAFSVQLVAMVVPLIAGVWWARANNYGALISLYAGTITWFYVLFVYPELPADMIGLGVGTIAMIVGTLMTQRQDPPKQLTDIDGNPLEATDRLGVIGLK